MSGHGHSGLVGLTEHLLIAYILLLTSLQRNFRLALRLHMDALIAKRLFWECLLHNNVTFARLSNAVARIESTVRAAERMYKQVKSHESLHTGLHQFAG